MNQRLLLALALLATAACSSSGNSSSGADGGGSPQPDSGGSNADAGAVSDGAAPIADGSTDDGGPGIDAGDAGLPAGWLYTSGAKIYVSTGGGSGTPWMGRGVNLDDIFLCGYDNTLQMTSPDQTLEAIAAGLVSAWKPTFVRISLGMASYTTESWIGGATPYKTPMTNVIHAIGANPNVYVLVTLRSDSSMIDHDTADGAEPTGLPSDGTSTPNATTFPTGTDATYQALVDTFASDSYVLFGLSNEPGGNTLTSATIVPAMTHAVTVIRAEEDKLHVPHHVISVQGAGWTSDISFYATSPIAADNLVYEIHGYPPTTSSYTYTNIPVIIGEYGTLADSTTFYADLEAKQIPNLAWDFEPYSDCAPDLLTVNQSSTTLTPSTWGSTVQAYLLAH